MHLSHDVSWHCCLRHVKVWIDKNPQHFLRVLLEVVCLKASLRGFKRVSSLCRSSPSFHYPDAAVQTNPCIIYTTLIPYTLYNYLDVREVSNSSLMD